MEKVVSKQSYPTVNQSFRLILRLVLISIPISIPFVVAGNFLVKYLNFDKVVMESLMLLISYLIPFVIVVQLGLKRIRTGDDENFALKFKKLPADVMVLSVITFLAAIFVMDPLTSLLPVPESVVEFLAKFIQPNVFSFLTIVVAAPVLEEILFRGIILEGFLRNYSPTKAIIWSALIFGMAHMNPWQTMSATLGGLMIGWIYWKSDSLIPGIIFHFINNLIGFSVITTTGGKVHAFEQLFPNENTYVVWLIIAIAILFLGYFMLKRKFKAPIGNKVQEIGT